METNYKGDDYYDHIAYTAGGNRIGRSEFGRRRCSTAGSADCNLGHLRNLSVDQGYLQKKEVTGRGPPFRGFSFFRGENMLLYGNDVKEGYV